MQVGTTKDHGLYNKPSTAVYPGELAAGTLPQYNTICINSFVDYLKTQIALIPLPPRQGFNPRSGHVGFMVGKV